jgi:hypothetical protein
MCSLSGKATITPSIKFATLDCAASSKERDIHQLLRISFILMGCSALKLLQPRAVEAASAMKSLVYSHVRAMRVLECGSIVRCGV